MSNVMKSLLYFTLITPVICLDSFITIYFNTISLGTHSLCIVILACIFPLIILFYFSDKKIKFSIALSFSS